MLKQDPEKKRRELIVHLTDLGIHALRMAQRCALTDFVDLRNEHRICFYRLVDNFVAQDAERKGVVARPGETPPRQRTFKHWVDYFWWLVDHVRSMAKHFGCKAERLYFRNAQGQVVHECDDDWFEFDDATDGTPYEPEKEAARWMAPVYFAIS